MNEASRDAYANRSRMWLRITQADVPFLCKFWNILNLSESVFKAQGINGKATFEALTPSRDGDLTEKHETREKIRRIKKSHSEEMTGR